MNGKPNVEPPWMSLKRLVETRMFDILRKEQGNRKYIRLYGAGVYWHAFEESACQLSRLFTGLEKNDQLPLGENGDHLLLETSCFNPPMDLYYILERIRTKGYYLVLAHPTVCLYGEKRLPTDKKYGREVPVQSLLNSRRIWKTYPKKPNNL